MVARLEAVRFDHGYCLGETMRESSRLVGVASESDGHSAFFVPPASDLGVEGPAGIDFKRPAADSKHMQAVTELFLGCAGVERPGFMWPVAKRVVNVGEHGERVGALDEADYLGQVLADDPGRWPLLVQVRRPGKCWPSGRQCSEPSTRSN